ncbi:MAG: PAS domain-containing protein [Methanomicrobiaceae archaeon]|nr:PAS domain-containing protein [Methanomicrobiaceae archaeon]
MMEITYQIIFESTVMVLSHIFYFPIIIVSFLYPKRGILISTMIAALYLVLIYILVAPEFLGVVSATMQFYVYVSVSVIVSIISGRIRSDRARFKSIFDYSEEGICVVDGETGRITEMNRKFADILKDWGFSEPVDNVAVLCGGDLECRQFLDKIISDGSLENHEMEVHSPDKRTNYALISASRVPNDTVVMTFTDITEGKLSADKIIQLNESLEEANKEANLYIDILAHDINNANTAAQGFAELLQETVSEDDRPYFEKMLAGIKQSSNIISKVIKIRDIHDDNEPPGPYSPDVSIMNAAEKLDLKVNYEPCGHMVIAGSFLDDLFFYLFENSISYTKKDPVIKIMSEERDGFVDFSITDNGPGIPDSKKSSLFLRFMPGGNSRKGRGLGLPVCWLIADHYGGDITAENVNPDNYKDGLKIVLRLKKA